MQTIANQLIFSPTDLTIFQESPFASWMDRLSLESPEDAPQRDPKDPLLQKLAEKGYAHEDATEKAFEAAGLSVKRMARGCTIEETLSAMQAGFDVIAQAKLELGAFAGFTDFLIKVPGISQLGDFYYEIWDTKLSRSLKPTYPIQLCCYAEMLANLQGVLPEKVTIVLGDGKKMPLVTREHFAFYSSLKQRFLAFHEAFDARQLPDPAESKSWGNWSQYAESILLKQDHLFQVATITRAQIKKLNAAGIITMKALAESELTYVKGISPDVLKRLIGQAAIQIESRGQDKPAYRLLEHDKAARKGLTLLPPHSDNDVFFDIEGYPLIAGGLEYLWGATYFDNGERVFRDFWAHDATSEKAALIAFITWVYERWQADPDMHIYHYASYEITACRKLMGRYGVCEHEVDELLRNEVFVDLYKVVKGAILLGEPRYSIKNVEHLYRGKRETDVGNGGESVVVYDEWRNLFLAGEETGRWQDSEVLTAIRDYNIDDCNSTQELVAWLRTLQANNNIEYLAPIAREQKAPDESKLEVDKLRNTLLAQAAKIKSESAPEAQFFENLAWWLEFHRRENKPVYWRMFDRLSQNDEALFDDADCIALCQRSMEEPFKPTPKARILAYPFNFDTEQPLKGLASQYLIQGMHDEKGMALRVKTVLDHSEAGEGIISLQLKSDDLPATMNLIPDEIVPAGVIERALQKVIKDIAQHQVSPYQAIMAFLKREKPRFKPAIDGPIIKSTTPEARLSEIIQVVHDLDNSYLVIQGPPGTGKSFTGARIIASLLKQGFRIGICSNSHKAILNLLKAAAKVCQTEKIPATFACSKAEGEEKLLDALGVQVIDNPKLAEHIDSPCLIGTTAWGFSRDDFEGQFDYLFIDEAGQVSVANLIAMSRSARNLILMGDQMQLGQPTQATHPADSGLSILDYLLHQTPTIAEDRGIFLGTTFRMHPEVNGFISDYVYEGKLHAAEVTTKRQVLVPKDYNGALNKSAGIIFIPVTHEGNTQASEEEVSRIKEIRQELLGRQLTDEHGNMRPITDQDILYVAPYNHQASLLRKTLGGQAKVGSVDKFQGQEAPIVIISMCSSHADDSPRGMDFIFDKNRLNVAVSRAQCMAIIVASPNLTQASISQIEQIPKVNMIAALMQY